MRAVMGRVAEVGGGVAFVLGELAVPARALAEIVEILCQRISAVGRSTPRGTSMQDYEAQP